MKRNYNAAAGKPFKRPKSSFKKSVVLSGKAKVYKSLDPYSPALPHCFKRDLQDGILFTNGALSVAVKDATGAVPTWLSLGALVADQGGVASTAQFGLTISPKLTDVINSTEFTNLFERYQIVKMTVKVQSLMGDSYNSVASATPYIYWVNDQTDATPPVSCAVIQQFPGVKDSVVTCESSIYMTCFPQPATILFNGVGSVGYGTANGHAPQWLETASPSIPHYGLKMYVRNWIASGANLGNALRIQPTLYFKLKEAH